MRIFLLTSIFWICLFVIFAIRSCDFLDIGLEYPRHEVSQKLSASDLNVGDNIFEEENVSYTCMFSPQYKIQFNEIFGFYSYDYYLIYQKKFDGEVKIHILHSGWIHDDIIEGMSETHEGRACAKDGQYFYVSEITEHGRVRLGRKMN